MKDNLIMYLDSRGEPNLDGGGSPYSIVIRRLSINYLKGVVELK